MRLTASGLACVRSGREVFSGVDFSLAAGEALLVLGRNGAGKSSLLRTIAGLVRIAAGKLLLEGGVADLTLPEQAHYVGHHDAIKPALTVEENLAFWARYLGGGAAAGGGAAGGQEAAAARDGVLAALDALALGDLAGLPAAYLSAGQRRRLSLARLAAVKRPVWLLDEPTSALDTATQERLAGLMRLHLGDGGIILAATHGPIGLAGTKELRLAGAALAAGPPGPSPAGPSPAGPGDAA